MTCTVKLQRFFLMICNLGMINFANYPVMYCIQVYVWKMNLKSDALAMKSFSLGIYKNRVENDRKFVEIFSLLSCKRENSAENWENIF